MQIDQEAFKCNTLTYIYFFYVPQLFWLKKFDLAVKNVVKPAQQQSKLDVTITLCFSSECQQLKIVLYRMFQQQYSMFKVKGIVRLYIAWN